MPRVKALKAEYMEQDIGMVLERYRKDKGLKQSDLARQMEISQQAYCKKVKNNTFYYRDIIRAFKALELTDGQMLKHIKI